MGLNLADIAIWWLVLEITGFIALPISFYFCMNLKDHGYSLSKPLGLLLLTYLSWIISIAIGYSYFSIVISLFIIAGISFIVCAKTGFPSPDKKYILIFESIFLLAFFIFAVIRSYSPDIYWTGGEKFMDMTFINNLLRTTEFPPLDPWMSGNATYYYYFGYLIVSNLIKITGIFPSIAFNLATASFFALSFTTASGIGYNFSAKFKYGLVTAFLVTVAGNLVGFVQLLYILLKKGSVFSFDYWTSSRVIPDTINEFPFFSFLQGDVHAHMISIAFQLLILLLLLNMIRSESIGWSSILILGLSIGFLYPLNTWDYPVYLALAIFIIGANLLLFRPHNGKRDHLKVPAMITVLAAASYLFYIPYHLSYKINRVISLVPSGRTSMIFYIAIFGLFLFLIFTFLLTRIRKLSRRIFNLSLILLAVAALVVIVELKLFALYDISNPKIYEFELLILFVTLIAMSLFSIRKERDRNNVFILILIITGTIISLFCEFFYVQDALGSGNLFRLNTVFKMYLQNWVLWGIAAGYVVFLFRNQFSMKTVWGAMAIILILMVSVYPVFATIGKSGDFSRIPDTNGEAYIKKEHPQDYQAILWFRNISGQPIVLQARGELYEWNTYITAFTGLPTVIGWAGHELNWRFPNRSEVDMRWNDVDTIYRSRDVQEVRILLRKYNVSYIYFGGAEAKEYESPKLFDENPEIFKKVFEYANVAVYKVT